jgi:hypothetical protein
VPRKIDFAEELDALKSVPDNTPRSLTTRVPSACLRKLYQLCARENLDLSAVVRRILEEQADLYLAAGKPSFGSEQTAMRTGAGASIFVSLAEPIRQLAEKACAGLAVDLPTLLQLIVTEALPDWIMRASRSQQRRLQALNRLEKKRTPELAVWEVYQGLASAATAASFEQVRSLIDEGIIRLELDEGGNLFLIVDTESTGTAARGVEKRGEQGVQTLLKAGVLAPDEAYHGTGRRLRLDRARFQTPRLAAEEVHPIVMREEDPQRVLELS